MEMNEGSASLGRRDGIPGDFLRCVGNVRIQLARRVTVDRGFNYYRPAHGLPSA
jgi:hypothetical protein